MTRPTAHFQSFAPGRPGWDLSFGKPQAQRRAFRPQEVRAVIDFAEAAAKEGKWAALLVSYEAAAAFDPALPARRSEFPLAWAAVFSRPQKTVPPPGKAWNHTTWKPALAPAAYVRAIAAIKRRIARGETYQANFTFPLRARFSGDAWSWFQHLARGQAAPYSAYLELGRWKILSLSPELFFEKDGARLTVRPMKGSAPRGLTAPEDAAFAARLARDPKERAENLMVVDLLRNDLAKIAHGVRATRLLEVETYPTLHQMTSTVEGKSRAPLADIFGALFPSGSVTGAPKTKTMEILRALEPAPRGVYTGAIGFLAPGGKASFNVAIRTVTLEKNNAVCPVGSGVTWPSDARREYAECLLKGEFLRRPPFSLFETLRLENGDWFLKEGHVARLAAAAARFGFVFSAARVEAALEKLRRAHGTGLWRARLTLGPDGAPRTEAAPLDAPRPWRIGWGRAPVGSQDPFLRHKTTHRAAYARAMRPGFDDVILVNERGEVTESTRANVVAVVNGHWFTPPLSSGILPGVFRGALLKAGLLKERVLRRGDLRRAAAVYLINSVRRWIPCRLAH